MFKNSLRVLGQILLYESSKTKKLSSNLQNIQYWRGALDTLDINSSEIVIVGILRGGLGVLDGISDYLPNISIGFIASKRNECDLSVSLECQKIPNVYQKDVYLIDATLGSGNTLYKCIETIKSKNPKSITCLCVISNMEGLIRISEKFSDVDIYTLHIEEYLDGNGMLYPGFGDIGERAYNQNFFGEFYRK